MKNKLLCSVLLVALVMNLTACGGGSEGTESSKQFPEPEQESSETVTNDILVNLAEADEAMREQASLMLQNLELKEYLDESINLINTEEWFQTMMPNLQEGYRNYFLQKDGQPVLYIQAGYNQGGESTAKVWYLGEQVRALKKEGNTLQLLETQMVEGNYQGAFESWTLNGETGDIYHETGTFGNGVITGEYEISIHEGTQGSDLFSLWSNKEGMSYTTYNGTFDERGISTLKQPSDKRIASLLSGTEYNSCIVYAIDVNDCLFEGLAEGEEPATYVFGIEKMGWEICPLFAEEESEFTGYKRNGGTLPKEKVVSKPAAQTTTQQSVPQPQQEQAPQEQPGQEQAPQQSVPAPAPSQPQQTTPPVGNDIGNSGNGDSDNGDSGNDNVVGGDDGDVEWSDSVL